MISILFVLAQLIDLTVPPRGRSDTEHLKELRLRHNSSNPTALLSALTMANLSPTTPRMIPPNRSASLSSSIASTLHPMGIYAPPQSEVTDTPSSTYSTPPALSSSLPSPSPSPISREFLRSVSRTRSTEHLAGPSLKKTEADYSKLPVSQITHRRKVEATSGAQPMAFRTVTVIPQGEDAKLNRTRLVRFSVVLPRLT